MIHAHHVDNVLMMQPVIRRPAPVLVVSVNLVGKDRDATKVNDLQ